VRKSSDPEDDPIEVAKRELRKLNRVVSPVSQLLVFDGKTFRQRWSSPSLLASYGMMALLDLAGERLKSCWECGRLFTASSYQARYCSSAHASKARKRAHRLNQAGPNSPHGKTGDHS